MNGFEGSTLFVSSTPLVSPSGDSVHATLDSKRSLSMKQGRRSIAEVIGRRIWILRHICEVLRGSKAWLDTVIISSESRDQYFYKIRHHRGEERDRRVGHLVSLGFCMDRVWTRASMDSLGSCLTAWNGLMIEWEGMLKGGVGGGAGSGGAPTSSSFGISGDRTKSTKLVKRMVTLLNFWTDIVALEAVQRKQVSPTRYTIF